MDLGLREYEWNSASQELHLGTTAEYVNLAERLRQSFDAQMAFALDQAGVSEIAVRPSVIKTVKSAERKLSDKSFDPGQIRDYLRAQGEAGLPEHGRDVSIEALSKAIEFLKGWEYTLGWKDRFAYPEPETGYRDFKAHILTEDPQDPNLSMVAEFKLVHADMEAADVIEIRAVEREYKRLEREGDTLKIRSLGASMVSDSRELRKAMNDAAAETAELNGLVIDPDYRPSPSDSANQVLVRIEDHRIGWRSHNRIQNAALNFERRRLQRG